MIFEVFYVLQCFSRFINRYFSFLEQTKLCIDLSEFECRAMRDEFVSGIDFNAKHSELYSPQTVYCSSFEKSQRFHRSIQTTGAHLVDLIFYAHR